MAKTNTISIDIGNSRIKLLDDFVYYAFDLNSEEWMDKIDKIVSITNPDKSRFVISSVNRDALEKLVLILKQYTLKYSLVEEILPYSKIVNFSKVSGMGNDRKLGLIGALTLATAPIVVVDCGTAVTVNFLDEKNFAVGGAIFPGLDTQAKALNHFTDQLPLVDMFFSSSYCGTNTQSAIQSGIFASVVGGIKELINKGCKSSFRKVKPTILLTGGNASKIAHMLEGMELIVESNLVLIGIRNLAKEHFSLIS